MIEARNRLTIRPNWIGKGITTRFSVHGKNYQLPHDKLIEIVRTYAPHYLETRSWLEIGEYSTKNPNRRLIKGLAEWEIVG